MTAQTIRQPSVVVPLYIYPTPGAWDPLLQAAGTYPSVSFVVIVNPYNGPGADALPDANYRDALRQLAGFPNVQVLGYVYCSYGSRSVADVQRDIDVYVGWNTHFKCHGIFFDEVPSNDDGLDPMLDLSRYTRTAWNKSTAPGIVVYNPGVIVGEEFYLDADLIVAFEQSQHQWQNWFLQQGVAESPVQIRAKNVVIIHSCTEDVKTLANQIVGMGFGGFFLTEQLGGGYNHWPSSWFEVLGALDYVSTSWQ